MTLFLPQVRINSSNQSLQTKREFFFIFLAFLWASLLVFVIELFSVACSYFLLLFTFILWLLSSHREWVLKPSVDFWVKYCWGHQFLSFFSSNLSTPSFKPTSWILKQKFGLFEIAFVLIALWFILWNSKIIWIFLFMLSQDLVPFSFLWLVEIFLSIHQIQQSKKRCQSCWEHHSIQKIIENSVAPIDHFPWWHWLKKSNFLKELFIHVYLFDWWAEFFGKMLIFKMISVHQIEFFGELGRFLFYVESKNTISMSQEKHTLSFRSVFFNKEWNYSAFWRQNNSQADKILLG